MSTVSSTFVATTETFMRDVVEASQQTPVLVDFWAPWCGPCKQLMPVLDRLANEYAGRFKLAKVNTDEEPTLAQQSGVRSLPTVALFKDGQVVGHFVGVQPEAQIRQLLDQHVAGAPEASEDPTAALLAGGDYTKAREHLQQSLARDPNNVELQVSLAELDVREGNVAAARSALSELQSREAQHAAVRRLAARLAFTELLDEHPDTRGLEQRAAEDTEARSILAAHKLLSGDAPSALEIWLEILRTQPQRKEEARQRLLLAFDLLGESDPAVTPARRAMAGLLF